MKIVASACDASAHKLAIVLEVHRIKRNIALFRAEIPDALDHVLALSRRGHQLWRSLVAYRHIVEVESEVRALVTEHPHKVVAGDGFEIVSGIADGSAKKDPVGLEQVHRIHDSGIVAVAPPGIIGRGSSLDREHEGDIAQFYDLFTERLIDEGRVRVNRKLHVVVLFCQTENIRLPHQRLAAGEHIEIDPQLLALGDDFVHILKAEVVFVAVLARPASHAVHIASRSGVEQDQPRDIAVVLCAILADGLCPPEERLIAKVERRGACHVGRGLVEHTVDELRPLAVRIGQYCAGVLIRLLAERVAIELLCDVHHLGKHLLTVFSDMSQCHIHHRSDSGTLYLMAQRLQRDTHKSLPPYVGLCRPFVLTIL